MAIWPYVLGLWGIGLCLMAQGMLTAPTCYFDKHGDLHTLEYFEKNNKTGKGEMFYDEYGYEEYDYELIKNSKRG